MTLPLSDITQGWRVGTSPADRGPDWTELFDRFFVIERANQLIDDLVAEIHRRGLPIHRGLDVKELALLYRFPIHVGVNIFIERLLRVAHSRAMNWAASYPEISYDPRYFKDTDEAVMTYYYDFALNNNLLHEICSILGGLDGGGALREASLPKPQEQLLRRPSGVRSWVKETMKRIIEWYVKTTKPPVVGEYSNWMRDILPFSQMLRFGFPVRRYPTNSDMRTGIRDCCRSVFLRRIDGILNNLEDEQKITLSDLFADYLDHVIPQSIVEGLTERFRYFEKLITKWNVRHLHSFIGYYYKENFKIFAILACRKGALLIGHAHGASNPSSSYKQCRNELAFLDFYFTWGKEDCGWLKEKLNSDGPQVISVGSAYLSGVEKWNKKNINPEKIVMLYPSGPLMDFMSDLQEIMPENHYRHRLEVISLLKALWKSYPKIKLLYKPFPGTFTDDPIKTLLADEFGKGSIELIDEKPLTLYPAVDIVLWDTISTGFCESISSGVPTLVFQSRYEYEQAAPLGKKLDEDLLASGMLFYDVGSGVESFNRIINEPEMFLQCREEAVRKFQEATAYPITKERFRTMLRETLPQNA